MKAKKNILFISPFFFPEPISTGKFNTDVVLALAEKGHQVTVLCFHPFYPDWKIIKSDAKLENINIIRGGKNLFFTKKTILRRLILEISFAFFVLKNIYKYQSKIDILLAIFPPSCYFFSIIPFLKKKITFIGMVHDLQQIYASERNGFLNKLITSLIYKVEKRTLQHCHKLIFLSEEMKNEAIKMYNIEPKKCIVQYPFHSLNNKITEDLDSIFHKEAKHIVYSGALGEKQHPYELFRFFEFLTNQIQEIECHFFSQGIIFDRLKASNKSPKIIFHSLVDKINLEELYFKSDLQIVPQKPNTSKGSFPSKLPNLLVSGTNILVITDANSELEVFFKKNNLVHVCTSWNFENLLEIVKLSLTNETDKNHQKLIAKEIFTIDEMIVKILS